MANPQLDKFLKEAEAVSAAKAAKPVAAAPKPPALTASPAAPVKVAATVERRAPSAEPVTPSAEDVKKAEKMRADLLEELPLEEYYKAAGSFGLSDSALGVLEPKIPAARFRELAGVQGLDLEDMAQKAGAGVPFAEYRRTREGVIGFKPAAERFTELDRVASDYEAAERGEAPQRTIGIQKAQETTTAIPGFGEGYEVGYTGADELIETTKPGEHQFSIAQQFVDSFEKAKPEVVHLTDMYAQNLGAGNTQKWIEKYVKLEARNRGITAADPDADEKMGKIRRDAVYYILAKKTIGQWTPGVFVKDVQITDAERAKPLGTGEGFGAGVRDTFAAMAPNVEIVGFNNKGQAVVRQESPAGVTLRLLDVLGVSPVGKIKGVPIVIPGQSAISGLITKEKDEGYLEAALRGVQTGATFLDATLDATKGQSTPVRTAAGLASLVPTVLYPDVTMAAGDAYKGISAFRKTLQDRKIAKAAAPLLDDLVAALKAGDYEKATKIEAAIRVHPELSKGNHGIMQAQIRGDAQVAEKLQAMNPGLASLNPNLADDLITVGANQSPELAEAIYGEAVRGYPFLHFSRKAKELAAKVDKEGIGPTLEAYVNSGDFGAHFRRVERAKAAFLKEAPRNATEAIDRAITGLAANLRAKGAEAAKLGGAAAADAPRYDRLAKLIEDNKAAIIADPRAALKEDGALRSALKADPVTGAADAREFRAAFYRRDAALLSKRIESLKTVDFETLYKHDLEVFDRAREAIEANIKSRMMAAELLKRELGAQSKIKVVPTEILDDLMEPGTERLSAFATAKFIRTMQQLPASADRKAWLAAFQTLDKQLRGAAALRDVPVDTYWRLIDIRVVDGKPVFVKGEQVVSGAKVPKGAGPLEGFVDIADVQTAIGRLRAALAGTDPTYNLKPLLRPDGTPAGGEVAVGDVVVRALQSFEEGAPYRVEVFVGGEQKAAFTNTGSLEDAISDGIDEAQNALNGRVATGAPAMREVVGAAPPKTAAQAAARTSPAAAAEEAAAVDKVAAMPPAAPLHPKTQEVLAGLDAALKADPDVVSRIISAVENLKAGSKLPPPPKGANKVLMGAVREELLKSGVLVKLDDGSVVKAGTLPEDVKVASTVAPTAPPVAPAPVAAAEAEAPVFQRVAEEVAPPAAPPTAPVAPPVAPTPVAPAAEAAAEPVVQRAAKVEAAPVAAARQLEEGAKLEQEARRRLSLAAKEGDEALDAAMAEVDAIAERNRALEKAIFATTPGAESTVIRRGEEALEFQRISEPATETAAEPVIQRAPAAEEPLPAVRKAKGFRDKNSLNAGVYEVDIGGKTRRFFRDSKEGFYPGSFVEDVPTSADVPVLPFLGDTIEDAVKALQRTYGAEEAPAAARAAEEAAEAAPAVEPAKSWADDLLKRNPEAVRAADTAASKAAAATWTETKSTSTEWRGKNMPVYTTEEGQFVFNIRAERSRRKGEPSTVFEAEVRLANPRVPEDAFTAWYGRFGTLEEAKAAATSTEARRGMGAALAKDIESDAILRPKRGPTEAVETVPAPSAAASEAGLSPEQLATANLSDIPVEVALPRERLVRGENGEWSDPRLTFNAEHEGTQYLERPRKGRSAAEMEQLLEAANGDLSAAVRRLAETTTVPEHRAVAERLLELQGELQQVPVEVVRPGHPNLGRFFDGGAAAGKFDPGLDRVYLLGPEYTSLGMSEEVLLHEALHAVTYKRLRYDTEVSRASREAIETARRELLVVVQDLRAHVEQAVAAGTATDFERSPAMMAYLLEPSGGELVSWALTNPGFQDYLKSVKTAGQGTLWDRFVRMMSTLLGFEVDQTSALSRVIEASDKLLKTPYTTPAGARVAVRTAFIDTIKDFSGAAKASAIDGYVEASRRLRARQATRSERADMQLRVAGVRRSPVGFGLTSGDYAGSLREALDAGDVAAARGLLREAVEGQRAELEEYLKLVPDETIPAAAGKPETTVHAVARAELDRRLAAATARAEELVRGIEVAPAAKAEEAVSAAPTQPSDITPVAEAPVVREEIVAPTAPPVKAEPTADELQATVARLERLRDAPIKRTNVTKNGFDVEVAGQPVRVERRGDEWFTSGGRRLGPNVTEAVESLRSELIQRPLKKAQDALRDLARARASAATVSSLEDALSGVKKIKTQKDAERFFEVAEQLTLDANEKAQVYESLAQKLEIMADRAKSQLEVGELETLSIRARDEVAAIRPAAETAPSAVAAAQDALTEAQRHAQAVTNIRSLTHRAQVERPDGTFLMFGTAQNGAFTPAFAFRAVEGIKPSEILEAVYNLMRESPNAMVAARREAEALLEGQTPIVREFPANKYANDADLKFGSRGDYASINVRREARDVAADRAKKARDAELIIARTLGDDIAAEWETVPQRFAVNAESRLRRAAEGLDSGKITQAEYNRLVAAVTDDLAAQKAIQAAKRGAPRQRGAAWVRSRLLAAQNAGVLDEAGVNLADWFIQQNPKVADDLGVSIRQAVEGSITAGDYEPVGRIVRLFKEKGDDLTAVHEILHHTERMLPADVQAAVRKEWAKQLTKAMENATPEQRPILEKMLAGTDRQAIRDAFVARTVPYEFYQYANPSEFWAVNASRIVSGRYAAFNAGLVAKAKQWLVEFAQKAKAVFGLSSDAPLIRGLDEVLRGDGTFVSRMLSDSGTFKSIEAPTELRQVRPAQAGGPEVVTGRFITGGATAAGSRGIIEIAAKTADPTTLLHEGAHFIRKTILDTEDMDNVTAWLNSMGVKVKHEFGEFVGSADDIELAEEMFATAFEKYVVTGKAPTPALERAFELIKNAFAGAYRWMKSDAAKELYGDDALSPQVTNVFDKYFTAVPQKPVESTFDIIVRETRGARATDAEGALDVLAREATRKGMPKTTREDLVKKITNLKLPDDVSSETVLLEFPAPVLGKTEWTKGEIVELQAEVVRRRNQMAINPLRQAMFGSPEEEKVTEQVFAALAEREEGGFAAGARGIARGMAKLVLGGDIVSERGTRALPEVLRRDLDTPARIIETTIGDSISVLKQSTRDNDPQFMFRFLAGENLRFKSGRRVLSSGHEHIAGFFDLYRNQWSSMTREEQALLEEWAQLLNTHPNPENLRNAQTISDALSRAPFPQRLTNVENFADLKAQVQAKSNAMVAAMEKFINLGGSGEGSIGGQLRKAIKDAAGEGEQIAFNEYRFAEVLLYLSGATQRRGRQFIPVDGTYTKDQLLAQAEILLTDAQRIYGGDDDPLFSRRLSVLVAAYGSSRRAKGELAALGALLTEAEAYAFKSWTVGYNVSPEMSAQLELVKNKFGLNAKFVNETILGSDVYVPAQARARMVDALAKAQFNNTKLSPTGDLYQKVWTYMKKRMTRGAFALRQRYFFVNTIDHFNQMYLMVGFAPAAASSARLLLQGLPVNLFGQAGETFIRLANRAGMGDRAAMERFRDLLSRGGDELAFRINNMFSTAKYRIDVNDILEGSRKLLLVGGNVYEARQLRDMFVAEGIFSSFDTRRLAEGVRMDGNIFANEMSRIAMSSKTDGRFANAAARLSDAAQDVTVDVVDDLADAWAERERVGAVVTLMETGIEARAACRVTIDALYDYSQSMTKGDRSFLVGSVLPFWAFQKNANQQFVNVLFSPYGAYRMMALQRLREGSTELASELYYGYIGGELGLDVDNMPQDMQGLYYAIMTRAHEIYGDKLPDDVRIGLRIALTGRVSEVVDGKYYELDASLIEMMRKGGLVPGGKFGGVGMADYMLAAPNKSGLPSYVRDRFGMVAPQRRNALVRHYSALMGGANEDYFYFMLPESSVETAYKHTATLLGGAFITAGALTPEWVGIPGVDVFAGGAGAISLGDVGRALQPVVDLERSPVFGLAVGMYSERGYPQRLHPVVASALQKMGSVPILRVPAKMDPFMGGTLPDTDEAFKARLQAANAVEAGIIGGTDETGNPADLISILGEDYVRMVQELNSKDLPADVMAIAKEERFYLPPGFMSLSFENSPLGELNREIIRLDQTAKEGADPAGTAAYYTRILLGSDVIQVAPSRTAQQEEPVRYTKTRDPI